MTDWLFYVSIIATGITLSELTRTVVTTMLRGVLMRLQNKIAGRSAVEQEQINQRIKAMMGM